MIKLESCITDCCNCFERLTIRRDRERENILWQTKELGLVMLININKQLAAEQV